MRSRAAQWWDGLREPTLDWPVEHPHGGAFHWTGQIKAGLEANGLRIADRDLAQEHHDLLLARAHGHGGSGTIAIDFDDLAPIEPSVADDALVYFKLQYDKEGYGRSNVVPGGYVPANATIYRYLPLLRAIRRSGRFRYDVYGRFGLRYGGAEIRRRAYEILVARDDFQFEGSLFRYPGGPEKVPYRRYLFEIPRAKVCVAMPGKGDLTFRLTDYLAVGACVVSPPLSARLPVQPVDGEHVVYCRSDLSDLADVCAELVRDDEERERIARNARRFFDRHLHRRRLGAYYAREITAASDRMLEPEVGSRRRSRRRAIRAFACAALAAVFLADVLVVLPEKLGDRPYNALGRDTRAAAHPQGARQLQSSTHRP